MKILINGLQLSNNNSGVQYYTQHLFNAIKKKQKNNLETYLYQRSSEFPSHFSRSPVSYLLLPVKGRLFRILSENLHLPFYLKKCNFDLFHSPNYVLPYFFKLPSVITIHDLITLDYPELCQTESVIYFRLLLRRSIKKASKIIVVSDTVKKDILKHYDVPSEKIKVIYHGINPIFKKTIDYTVRNKYHFPEKYILFVGNIEPKKNLVRLIKAFHLLIKDKEIPHKLVIAGGKGWKCQSVFNTVKELGLEEKIIFTGYVPEEDLPAIYSMADLFVFPSLYEGFGFPPLEAMACEVPVLVSNKGSLPEITGGACIQVEPYDIRNIADGMYKLICDSIYRSRTIAQGKRWVQRFSWEKAAKETIDVYQEALEQKI